MPRHRRAATSVEYLMVLALVVLPLAIAVVPLMTSIIIRYGSRIAWVIRSPLG